MSVCGMKEMGELRKNVGEPSRRKELEGRQGLFPLFLKEHAGRGGKEEILDKPVFCFPLSLSPFDCLSAVCLLCIFGSSGRGAVAGLGH